MCIYVQKYAHNSCYKSNSLITKEPKNFYTAWKVSKYGVISGPYFPVFRLKTEKYGPEITPHLGTFHAVLDIGVT